MWVKEVIVPECQHHMVNGTPDYARNQGAASVRKIFAVLDGLGKGSKEVGVPLWEDLVYAKHSQIYSNGLSCFPNSIPWSDKVYAQAGVPKTRFLDYMLKIAHPLTCSTTIWPKGGVRAKITD